MKSMSQVPQRVGSKLAQGCATFVWRCARRPEVTSSSGVRKSERVAKQVSSGAPGSLESSTAASDGIWYGDEAGSGKSSLCDGAAGSVTSSISHACGGFGHLVLLSALYSEQQAMADTGPGTADATLAHEAAETPLVSTTQPTSTSTTTSTSAPVLAPPIDFTKLGGASHPTETGGYTVPATASTASEPTASNPAPAASTASEQEKKDVVNLVTGTGPAPSHPAQVATSPPPEPRTDIAVPQSPSPAAPRSVAVQDEAELEPESSQVVVAPTDKAPAPAVEPAPPAAQAILSQDAAPKPAVEAAPVQLADAKTVPPPPPRSEPVPVAAQPAAVVEPTAVRAPTGPTAVPNDGALSAAPPAVSKPIVPAAESHLAEHPATETDTDHVLPLGQQVHPVHQAAALQDAPDSLVNAQVEKQKADKRALYGEAPKGTIVPGMEDDKLWTMLRRFDAVSLVPSEPAGPVPGFACDSEVLTGFPRDGVFRYSQQVLHTLTPPTSLPKGEPDLRPSTLPAVPFEPDLLKGNLMRVYATVGVWGIYGARELMRLMDWAPENRRRTAIWCTVSLRCTLAESVLAKRLIDSIPGPYRPTSYARLCGWSCRPSSSSS